MTALSPAAPLPLPDAEFIDWCERVSLEGHAINYDDRLRLFRLSGGAIVPPNWISYPPLWGMIEDARKNLATPPSRPSVGGGDE